MEEDTSLGPWPDVATARFFLQGLAEKRTDETAVPPRQHKMDVQRLANWLIDAEIAGLALGRYGAAWPALRRALHQDHFLAVGEWELHGHTLTQLAAALQEVEVTVVLLKGAALALTVYPERSWRTMSDIDLWVQEGDMSAAVSVVQGAGFTVHGKEERPLSLQRLSGGEIQLYRADWAQGLVELHWSAFPGWWLQRVAIVEPRMVWQRRQAIPGLAWFSQLAPEDMIIQIGVHLAINHQFNMKALQGLTDIALTARRRNVDWQITARRARRWRLATAVYTVLHLLDQLIGAEGVEIALRELQPGRLRRWLIGRFVSPQSLLAGRDVRSGRARYLLLLLLVDRPRDMLYLIFRTLWPEAEWMAARYGQKPVSRWRHIWNVVRHGQV